MAWRDVKFGELVQVEHGFAFLGEYFATSGSHIVLTPGNFFDEGGFKFKGDKEKWYRGPIPSDYVLKEGDLIVAMTEQAEGLLGSCAIVPRSGLYLHNQRLGLVQLRDSNAADKRFVYYLLNWKPVREQIRASASGAKIRHTAPSRIAEVEIRVPPLPLQRRIAGILRAYDELIENNRQRIQNLEDMVRSLYAEWLIKFRFPGHETRLRVRTAVGNIPDGWEVRKLHELVENVRRNVPKGALREPQSYVGLEHIPRRALALDSWETITTLGSHKLAFRKGDVLFGKIRPYFHKVCVAPFDGLCSADTIVIRPRRPEHAALVIACVSSDAFVARASATANGAKMPRANWEVLEDYDVLIPNAKIAEQFSALFTKAISEQNVLISQIQNLRRTRDLLLPRLLSGDLEVKAN